MSELFDLSGRVAIVTGTSRGLGQYLGRALARAGADLVITSRDPATLKAFQSEVEAMGRIAAEGIAAGGLGFTTSRTLNHRTSRGEPTPTLTASRDELVGIARAIGTTGTGVLQAAFGTNRDRSTSRARAGMCGGSTRR